METPDSRSTPELTGNGLLKTVRRVIIFVLGMSVLIVGLLMVVLPGPAMVVIPAGLGILATEFLWARRWLRYLQNRAKEVVNWTVASTTGAPAEPGDRPNDGPPQAEKPGAGPCGSSAEPLTNVRS